MNAAPPVTAAIGGSKRGEAAPESTAASRSEAASGCTISLPLCAFRGAHDSNEGRRWARILAANMLSDPAAAAWVAAGRPAVNAPAPVAGRCGRCGEDGPTVTVTRIVSEKFTGFDDWPFGSRRLCVPCAWAYSRPPHAVPAMLITSTTVTEHPKGAGLAVTLSAGPLPATQAVVLPTSHRRHILATAQWGHLATDGLVIAWSAAAASRLVDLATVRPVVTAWVRAHATESTNGRQIALDIDRMLLREMPPYPLLATQPRDNWPRFLAAWTALQPWRTVVPLWVAAKILTTPGAGTDGRSGAMTQ